MKKIIILLICLLSLCSFSIYAENLHLVWQKGQDGKLYWYENGKKQGTYDDPGCVMGDGSCRGREIYDGASDGWYWLDSVYDGAKAEGKEVWIPYIYQGEENWTLEDILREADTSGTMAMQVYKNMIFSQGKWVRYDSQGKMAKGWYTVEGPEAIVYPSQVGNTYYYDQKTGLMAKGVTVIDGKTYYFDKVSGVLLGEVDAFEITSLQENGNDLNNEINTLKSFGLIPYLVFFKNSNKFLIDLEQIDENKNIIPLIEELTYSGNRIYDDNLYSEYRINGDNIIIEEPNAIMLGTRVK